MSRRTLFCYVVMVLSIITAFSINRRYASAAENNRITQGVFIDEVDVSNMTAEEAEEAVNNFVEDLKTRKISVKLGDNIVSTTLGEIGYSYKLNNIIEQALKLGTTGNLVKRYKDLKDISHGGIKYQLEYIVNENGIREFVSTKATEYNVEPVNASVSRKNGKMIYTDHVPGKQVDVEATVQNIADIIRNNWDRNDLTVEAYMEDVLPVYTRDIVEQCNTILGSFTTEYADSSESRAKNLANGARLINNTVVYPGEVFSAYEHLAPFTQKNGYHVAGAYSQGKVIDSIGGGACQVSTTLYNAALYAELEIVQRQEHSMTISYVDLSRDAAIAGTYKDLKFKNNTDVPILIEAYTKGRKITFNIWGHETRDTKNRRIEFESKIISTTSPPPDVVEKDPTKPVTYKKVTQSAHTGYKAELYKVVYENGKEVSRTLVNKSTYAAAPRYITVGTMEVDETKDESTSPDNKDKKNKDASDKKDDVKEKDTEENTQEDNVNIPDEPALDDFFWDPEWDEESPED